LLNERRKECGTETKHEAYEPVNVHSAVRADGLSRVSCWLSNIEGDFGCRSMRFVAISGQEVGQIDFGRMLIAVRVYLQVLNIGLNLWDDEQRENRRE
jgi:hypothetical protein